MTSTNGIHQRLDVLHSVSVWLPQTETWLYDQITMLPAWVESHVVCEKLENNDQFPMRDLHSLSQASVVRRLWEKSLRKLGLRRHFGYLLDHARKQGAGLVHSHFGNVAWADRPIVRALGARHVATFYGWDVNCLPTIDPRWHARYRELFASVDCILCEGPHMASCIQALGCAREKIRVHHLGVRVDAIPFRPRVWRSGQPLKVLMASSFREKKGIPYGVAALGAIASKMPIEVTIVGDASKAPGSQKEKGRILDALDRHGLRTVTRLAGYCSYERLMQEAAEHHIFLAPSVTADDGDTEGGAPVGILHMAASGMPVVSTCHCDIPNLLPFATDLADERDVEGLVRQILRLVREAGNWEPQLVEARRHVEANFNAVVQGQRLAAIYAELAERERMSIAYGGSSIGVEGNL